LPLPWGLWMVIEGDVRFLAHRDCARLIERAGARAHLPLKYTEGFNPHPVLSLVLPRPVGVASRDDLVVLRLTEPLPGKEILTRMNRQVPSGVRFTRAETLASRPRPKALRAWYEWPVPPGRAEALAPRVEAFREAASWPIERHGAPRRRGEPARTRRLDLTPLVPQLAFDAHRLHWTLAPVGDVWARPAEVLEALGLDGRVDLASVVRTAVDYGIQPPAQGAQGPTAHKDSP